MNLKLFAIAVVVLGCGFIGPTIAGAQDLEPRAYAAAPTGLRFVVVAIGRSTGGVIVDASLPVDDVQASVNSAGLGLGATTNLFGRTALLLGVVPYAWADASGRVGENAEHITRSGFADPRFKLAVNLLGGRAMSVAEFARSPRPTILGVSLTVSPPLGEYDRTKLVNLGAHRWAYKPEVGFSHLMRKWTIEGYAGVWLFTANDEFYTGSAIRTQDPIIAVQGHASYTFRPRLWIAANGTWYSGGKTNVNGLEKADLQRNSRLGVTLSLPFTASQSLKLSASTGATTRIGADFKTFGAAWQLSWFD